MWRHEDIWRTLGGGIDFITGEPLADEWAQSRRGAEGAGMVRMAPAPLIHGAAMVATLACLFGGDTAVIMPKFDPDAIWSAVQRHKVNVLSVIGDAMARPLMEALATGGYDTSSLVSFNSTAALFSPAVKDACVKALPTVFISEAIGSTETGFAGIAFVSADDEHRGGPTVTAGPDVIVLGDDNEPVGPGQVGRLRPGGHVPLGYYEDPARTSAMFAEVDGRRVRDPGDMARVEEDGTMTLLGRGNTCVNSGGEKVFPEEVEGALKSHPDVFDVLVIGVPDDLLGQRVAALVQPRPGAEPDPAALAGARPPAASPATRSRAASGSPTRSGARCPARPTTPGRASMPPPTSRPWTRAGERQRWRPHPPLRPARHRAPRRRVHPVRARRRRDQPGRRPGGAGLRPVQRPGRAGHGPGLDGPEHRRPPVRHRRGHRRPGSRPRAGSGTSAS